MNLSIVDIVIIIVIGVAAIIGIKKGFIKMLFDLIKKFASLIIAYFLLKPTRNFLAGTIINDKIYDSVLGWATKKGGIFTEEIPEGGLTEAMTTELKLPSVVTDLLKKVIGDGSNTTGMTLGEVLSQTLTYYALTIIAFIGLLIIFSIVIRILSKFFTNLFESNGLKGINRLLGLALGAGIAVIIVWIAFIVADFAATCIDSLANIIEEYIDPTNTEPGVARWLYNNNLLTNILGKLLEAGDVLKPNSEVTECIINTIFIK